MDNELFTLENIEEINNETCETCHYWENIGALSGICSFGFHDETHYNFSCKEWKNKT